ncbi:MAG: glycosyltransferase family 4 protein, partial [Bacteroidetes bacterium]|nr:glycosyltransferase family 4 protein [Bacteroidota bacterium]
MAIRYSNGEYLSSASWTQNIAPFLKRVSYKGFLRLPSMLVNGLLIKPTNSYLRFKNKQLACKKLDQRNFDVFHPTYYAPYFLRHIGNKPFVLTIHDLIHERFPQYYISQKQVSNWKSQLIPKASKIIAVSNFTKNDILSYYQVSPERIAVVYHGNSLDVNNTLWTDEIQNLKLPQRYLLYIGDRKGYKNFNFFIECVSEILVKDRSLHIVCGGGPCFSTEENSMYHMYNIQEQVHHEPIHSDAQLIALYKRALAFVFPSLYEGFGIPVLEAFACNCPLIICNAGALPEIAGDACLKFEPHDKQSLVSSIEEILSSDNLRKMLIAAGKIREREFSWNRAANETKQVYTSLL